MSFLHAGEQEEELSIKILVRIVTDKFICLYFFSKGNSCFSFLTPIFGSDQPMNSRKINNEIILSALGSIDINAELSGRNDILLQGKKVNKCTKHLIICF